MIKYLLTFFVCCSLTLGTSVLRVPNTIDSNSEKDWDALFYTIEKTTETDFILLWSGYGGRISQAVRIFKRLNSSNKHIVIKIIGPSISAHALVRCYVPSKVVFTKGTLVLHGAFEGHDLNGNKDYDDKITRDIMDQCIKSGLITKMEEDLIVQQRLRLEITPGTRTFYPDWR